MRSEISLQQAFSIFEGWKVQSFSLFFSTNISLFMTLIICKTKITLSLIVRVCYQSWLELYFGVVWQSLHNNGMVLSTQSSIIYTFY